MKGNMTVATTCLRRCPCADHFRVFPIFVVSVLIGRDQIPTEMSKMTPAVENHPAIKRLPFGGHDQAIVFHPCAGVRFPPMKFESLEFQSVERKKQVLCPLVAITAFPEAMIDEEIVEDRRAEHLIFLP